MQKISFFFLFLCSPFVLYGSGPHSFSKRERRDMMKNYYLNACIIEVYETKTHVDDVSASIYFELANYHPEAFQIVKERAKTFIESINAAPYYEKEGYRPYMQIIIESYKSKEISRFIRSLDRYMMLE